MKLLIASGVFGDIALLNKDIGFMGAQYALLAGNNGINHKSAAVSVPTYFVAGKYEEFGFIKEEEPLGRLNCKFIKEPFLIEGRVLVSGVSGTYSPLFYEEESAPIKHMRKPDFFSIKGGTDIALIHNIPGQLAKSGSLDFHRDLFDMLDLKDIRYVFVGGYNFEKQTSFIYLDTTVVFLPSLNRGYAIIDTLDWSCYFQNRI